MGMPTPRQMAAMRVVSGRLLSVGGSVVVGGWVGAQLSVGSGPVHGNSNYQKTKQIAVHNSTEILYCFWQHGYIIY